MLEDVKELGLSKAYTTNVLGIEFIHHTIVILSGKQLYFLDCLLYINLCGKVSGPRLVTLCSATRFLRILNSKLG